MMRIIVMNIATMYVTFGLWGDRVMMKTITLDSRILIQGLFVRQLGNGKIVIRVGEQTFTGIPVGTTTA